MNKSKLVLFLYLFAIPIFAESLDMKYFTPTEWQYMEELSEQERKDFEINNQYLFDICAKISWSHLEERHCPEQNVCFDETKVYKEETNGDTFYWILIPGNRMNITKEMMEGVPWVTKHHYFLGLVRVENGINKLLMFHPTLNIDWDEKSCHYFARTYQIIKGKEKNKGVIYYENSLDFDVYNGMKFKDFAKLKNQPVGSIKKAYYYLFENEPYEAEYYEGIPGFILKNWESINISASDFLWDLKNPLKYGLQNAFDQDPATSYVENTKDDLFEFKIFAGPITKYYIINGYAQNETLYKNNNRIIEIAYEWIKESSLPQEFLSDKNERFPLEDNQLKYQVIDLSHARVKFSNGYLYVSNILAGEKYNDTCISELNMYLKKGDFIFGDIND